jgi:hypothetical protein
MGCITVYLKQADQFEGDDLLVDPLPLCYQCRLLDVVGPSEVIRFANTLLTHILAIK